MYQILSEKNNNLAVKMPDFDPIHTFLCGQCFRWNQKDDGSWIGVAHGRILKMSWDGEVCTFFNMDKQEFVDIWVNYFDLDTNYDTIKKILAKKDEHLREAVVHGHGIRLLNQDFNEVLFSFLISQNNNIPRIKQIIDSLSHSFGKPLDNNMELYGFPDVFSLASASIDSLNVCRGGYRCRYISDTAKKLQGIPGFADNINRLTKEDARELLLSLPGIGPKVADCVLLYSGIDRTAFPIDRWVKRVIETLYLKKESDEKSIKDFSQDYFGDLAGIAQQYLFYYAREKKIGL
ncbi:MAG: DNA glycosylase [Ruminiclostridium sp.]|nr:DNA glycosylase [Ruminiclostridium sp.]